MMATLSRCDRCGDTRPFSEYKMVTVVVQRPVRDAETFDLCGKCADSLISHIKNMPKPDGHA